MPRKCTSTRHSCLFHTIKPSTRYRWDGQHREGECEFFVVHAAPGGVVPDDLHDDGVVAVGVDG